MPKNLVIVESPAKAKTIEKFLGKEYEVLSSFGHIRDLPKKGMGIDLHNNFEPKYAISHDKKDVVKKLKEKAKKADVVWLASDEDREGEAIAWHLYETLDLKEENTRRIVFHEITKPAIDYAIAHPREIDQNLVDAQQARRILDRIVGFELSPVLWKKVKGGLSAGRVQSVAVRLIAERESEINDFTPKHYYKIAGTFLTEKSKTINANLNEDIESKKKTQEFLEQLKGQSFKVSSVETKPSKRTPAPPFTTSTMQQEASHKLGYSVGRTMQLAQRLYEAGHITYMRTDSVNLSKEALHKAKAKIEESYGKEYSKTRQYSTKSKGAQEAHEAIRPTNFESLSPTNDSSQNRLYQLIWKRALASQMADAQLERTTIKINTDAVKATFVAKGEVIKFDGFLKLYQVTNEDEEETEEEATKGLLPKVNEGEQLAYKKITADEKYSKQPSRYNEATLVKKLEDLGIGRPSTYAPTISTIQRRGYVEIKDKEPQERKVAHFILEGNKIEEKDKIEKYGAERKRLFPTDMGIIVNEFLEENFDEIVDYNFTARVESAFDKIAEGDSQWTAVMDDFYKQFHPVVEDVEKNADRAVGQRLLGTDPKSGQNVYSKLGKYGPIVQIGETESEEKPQFAGLLPDQNLQDITLEEALKLFDLPKSLGEFEGKEVEVNTGRYGPYVKYDEKFISIPKDKEIFEVDLPYATELIKERQKQDAPIYTYQGKDVTKGKGRFGPYIKWNDMFINVNKKYDFDALSDEDIVELIETKIQKEKDKIIQSWPEEGISIEKGRWKRNYVVKGKKKVQLDKEVDPTKVTLEQAKKLLK